MSDQQGVGDTPPNTIETVERVQVSIRLPDTVWDEVERGRARRGYRSRSEYVRHAIRLALDADRETS